MEIYLIRHTKPKIEKGVCYGFSDLELNNSYQEEKNILLEKITIQLQKKKQIDNEILIYTSSLKRCKSLAENLAKDLKLNNQNNFKFKVKEHDSLKEMNFGDWERQKWNEINEAELRIWTDNFVTESTPNGESFEVLSNRVIDFWQINIEATIEKKLINSKNKTIFIVCHAGVIRSILCHVLQIPLQNAFSISIDYGSISKLNVFETHTQVEFLNM